MQQAGQFTPEQLIVAGRRAEAQGQPAYAQQFYKYIADHFPSTTEAYEARDALYRLQQPAPEYQPAPPAPMPAPRQAAQQPYPSQSNGQEPSRPAPTLDTGHGPSHAPAPRKADGRKANKKARTEETESADDADVPVARGYRIGRFVAAMLGTIGWLLLVSAVVMTPLIFAALSVKSVPKGLKEAIAGNLIMVGAGTFGALFLGLFAIFAAQVARASFDTADQVRALLQNSGSRDR